MNKPKCKGCILDEYLSDPNTDLDGCHPPVVSHTCKAKGPKTRFAIFKALVRAAKALYKEPQWPGGNYHAQEEIDGLIGRLAE